MHASRTLLAAGLVAAIPFALTVSSMRAQCATQWVPGVGVPGVLGNVFATTVWDRDGAGPLPPLIVIGGSFTGAGTVMTNNIAAYDPANQVWSTFGSGTNDEVDALAVLPNGDLVAAGEFWLANGIPVNFIARWNGTTWSPLGAGVDGKVSALTVLPNGDLVAGGWFSLAGGSPANRIALWDGSTWSPLGSGTSGPAGGGTGGSSGPPIPGGLVLALTTLANGDLVAGGTFTTAGGVAAPRIARWDGASWSPMCSSLAPTQDASVTALVRLANGDLVAAGTFSAVDGVPANNIARWNGATWSPLGLGTSSRIDGLAVSPNGDLFAGGVFQQAGTVPANRVARWDGTNWSPLGSGASSYVSTLVVAPNGHVFAGGYFSSVGGVASRGLGVWNGTSWSATFSGSGGLGGADAPVVAQALLPNGDLVVGGAFLNIGGIAANRIARWNGSAWSPLGSGISSFVNSLVGLSNGDLIAGGSFNTAGGVPAIGIARWNGSSWSPLGSGITYSVGALAVLANGDVVACGTGFGSVFSVDRWDGNTWQQLGGGTGYAWSLAVAPNDDVFVAGAFSSINGTPVNNIARWNGASWSPLGGGSNNFLTTMTAMPNGDVIAAGGFIIGGFSVDHVARWNGITWSPLGTGVAHTVRALLPLPDGDVLAAGGFLIAGSGNANRIARFNGTSWSPLGQGCDGVVNGLLSMPNGDVIVTGEFNSAGGLASAKVARLTTTCPAAVVSQGLGCTGSGGLNSLTARSLPWTGSTFRATATGMPASALVLSVYGFTPASLPMASVMPQGLPGCEVHVLPDLTELHLPVGGATLTTLPVPDSAALAGLVLHQFVVSLEVSASLQILAVTSSNALRLTVGVI
ncbi:MAG TPA: hypothetical protein VF384_17885 [Planctomycetota bacterium]